MEPFNWTQARSLLERWGWIESVTLPQCWSLGGHGKTSLMVPTVEDLECRDEYDRFVVSLGEIYGLNLHALERSLEVELCQ